MSRRFTDVALICLALVTVLMVGLALRQPAPPPADLGAPLPTSADRVTEVTATETYARVTTDDPTPTEAEAETATDPASDTETVTVTQTMTAAPEQPRTLDDVRSVLTDDDPVTVLVLGDLTSNARSEWVHLWASDLAEDRPVTIAHWDESGQQGYVEPDVLSETGEGGDLTIWNGSQTDTGPDYARVRLGAMVPEPPDLIVYSHGHELDAESAGEELDALHSGLVDRFGDIPAVVVLQNPRLGEDDGQDVRDAVEAWAEQTRLPVVDVAAAFLDAGDLDSLVTEDAQTTSAGSRLWADTVSEALTP